MTNTMILDPVIIECPHCHLRSMHYQVMSGTIHSSESYTDGRMDVISGAFAFNPVVLKCRYCSGHYFFQDAISEETQTASGETLPDLEFSEYHLGAEELAEGLSALPQLDKERERAIRILFWQSVNDLIRRPAFFGRKRTRFNDLVNFLITPIKGWKRIHPRYREYVSWQGKFHENLHRLLTLLDPAENPDDIFMMVEINREMGRFREARILLKDVPSPRGRKFITFQRNLIARHDRFVRKYPS